MNGLRHPTLITSARAHTAHTPRPSRSVRTAQPGLPRPASDRSRGSHVPASGGSATSTTPEARRRTSSLDQRHAVGRPRDLRLPCRPLKRRLTATASGGGSETNASVRSRALPQFGGSLGRLRTCTVTSESRDAGPYELAGL